MVPWCVTWYLLRGGDYEARSLHTQSVAALNWYGAVQVLIELTSDSLMDTGHGAFAQRFQVGAQPGVLRMIVACADRLRAGMCYFTHVP